MRSWLIEVPRQRVAHQIQADFGGDVQSTDLGLYNVGPQK